MLYVNKMEVLGNLGSDPELKVFGDKGALVRLSIATTEFWKVGGESRSRTEWHTAVVRGKLAATVAQKCSKGNQVYVCGPIHTRKYTDATGVERDVREIIVEDIKW